MRHLFVRVEPRVDELVGRGNNCSSVMTNGGVIGGIKLFSRDYRGLTVGAIRRSNNTFSIWSDTFLRRSALLTTWRSPHPFVRCIQTLSWQPFWSCINQRIIFGGNHLNMHSNIIRNNSQRPKHPIKLKIAVCWSRLYFYNSRTIIIKF